MTDSSTPAPDLSAATTPAPTETLATSAPVDPVPAPVAEVASQPVSPEIPAWTIVDVIRRIAARHPWFSESDERAALAAIDAWEAARPQAL